MPFFLLGQEYVSSFWSTSWYLPIVFLVAVALIDGYFIAYWRLLALLEEENWNGLVDYLEEQCIRKERLRVHFVRTLLNSYFVTNKVSRIEKLEETVRNKKPSLLRKFALQFGIPKMLHEDPEDIVKFFEEFKDARVPRRQWVRFLYAFGLLMKRENTDGREVLIQIIQETKDPILRLVSLYTIDPFKTIDDQVLSLVDREKNRIISSYTREAMEKELSRNKENVAVLILGRLVSDAMDWLYGGEEKSESDPFTGEDENKSVTGSAEERVSKNDAENTGETS